MASETTDSAHMTEKTWSSKITRKRHNRRRTKLASSSGLAADSESFDEPQVPAAEAPAKPNLSIDTGVQYHQQKEPAQQVGIAREEIEVLAEGQEALWVEEDASIVQEVEPDHGNSDSNGNKNDNADINSHKNGPKKKSLFGGFRKKAKQHVVASAVKKETTKTKKVSVVLLPDDNVVRSTANNDISGNNNGNGGLSQDVQRKAAVNMIKARKLLNQALTVEGTSRLQDSEELAKVAFAHAKAARMAVQPKNEAPDLESSMSNLTQKGTHAAFQAQKIVFSHSFPDSPPNAVNKNQAKWKYLKGLSTKEVKGAAKELVHTADQYAGMAKQYLESMLPKGLEHFLLHDIDDEDGTMLFDDDTIDASTLGFEHDQSILTGGTTQMGRSQYYHDRNHPTSPMGMLSISSLNDILDASSNDEHTNTASQLASPRSTAPVIGGHHPQEKRDGSSYDNSTDASNEDTKKRGTWFSGFTSMIPGGQKSDTKGKSASQYNSENPAAIVVNPDQDVLDAEEDDDDYKLFQKTQQEVAAKYVQADEYMAENLQESIIALEEREGSMLSLSKQKAVHAGRVTRGNLTKTSDPDGIVITADSAGDDDDNSSIASKRSLREQRELSMQPTFIKAPQGIAPELLAQRSWDSLMESEMQVKQKDEQEDEQLSQLNSVPKNGAIKSAKSGESSNTKECGKFRLFGSRSKTESDGNISTKSKGRNKNRGRNGNKNQDEVVITMRTIEHTVDNEERLPAADIPQLPLHSFDSSNATSPSNTVDRYAVSPAKSASKDNETIATPNRELPAVPLQHRQQQQQQQHKALPKKPTTATSKSQDRRRSSSVGPKKDGHKSSSRSRSVGPDPRKEQQNARRKSAGMKHQQAKDPGGIEPKKRPSLFGIFGRKSASASAPTTPGKEQRPPLQQKQTKKSKQHSVEEALQVASKMADEANLNAESAPAVQAKRNKSSSGKQKDERAIHKTHSGMAPGTEVVEPGSSAARQALLAGAQMADEDNDNAEVAPTPRSKRQGKAAPSPRQQHAENPSPANSGGSNRENKPATPKDPVNSRRRSKSRDAAGHNNEQPNDHTKKHHKPLQDSKNKSRRTAADPDGVSLTAPTPRHSKDPKASKAAATPKRPSSDKKWDDKSHQQSVTRRLYGA